MPYFMDHEDKIMGQFSPFVIVEAIYMVWFTVEFIIRATCCPSKISFAKKSMNWIDLLGRYLVSRYIVSFFKAMGHFGRIIQFDVYVRRMDM